MLAGMTRREKLFTLLAVTATFLFALDTFALTPYREGIASRREETKRLAEQRTALLAYADTTLAETMEREAERIERQMTATPPETPVEPTAQFIPHLIDATGGGTLSLVGLTRQNDAERESYSLTLLADHAGAIRFLRRLDRAGGHVTRLALNRTNGNGAPLAVSVTLERSPR